ncbi:Uncharacterised protein [Serratia liquefaciens]|uniref:hypothetical protein n=1 Tax=Serratia liquefaciens TaxID=614 RepID=UPI00217B93B6|nr:hypothetical protein [Serratia liquefaciens]CAI1819176.1 Uncharacterised protein [Serratia liquefaciens]
MKLPERLYYPLDNAAKELECDISDIIHYGANGYLNLCVKIYETPRGIEEVSEDWSANLLVNEKYLNSIVKEYYAPFKKFEKTESGAYVAEDETNFDFVNSYARIHGKIQFWVDKKTNDVCDYTTSLYGIYGLLQLSVRDIYINEENILKGNSFKARSFVIPIDETHTLASGYFKNYISDFAHEGWVSDYIDKDSHELRDQTIENMISKDGDPIIVDINNIYITHDEIERIKSGKVKPPHLASESSIESAKTAAKKGEMIVSLLGMIPEISNINIDGTPVSKIKEIVEALAAEKGVDFPETHTQTWARYLGRMRKVK